MSITRVSQILKKGKFEEIGETPYQKPQAKTPSKTRAVVAGYLFGLMFYSYKGISSLMLP